MGDSNDGVVLWVGSFYQDGDKMSSHSTAHLPAPTTITTETNKMQDCHNMARTGSTDTRFSGIVTSRWDGRLQRVLGRLG